MLVNLTPKIKEIARRISVAKEENFNYLPQSDLSFLLETGIYRNNFDFNFSKEEFTEKLIFIVLPITFITIIGSIFIPIKNEAYMIYGLGGTIDYLKESPAAKQLPEKTLQMLNAWEDNQIEKLQKDTTKTNN